MGQSVSIRKDFKASEPDRLPCLCHDDLCEIIFVLLDQISELAQTSPSLLERSLGPRPICLFARNDSVVEIRSSSYGRIPKLLFSSWINAANRSFGPTSLAINNLERSTFVLGLTKRFAVDSHCRTT